MIAEDCMIRCTSTSTTSPAAPSSRTSPALLVVPPATHEWVSSNTTAYSTVSNINVTKLQTKRVGPAPLRPTPTRPPRSEVLTACLFDHA